MNMDGDLTSRNMNNGKESNKDNLRFSNLDNSLRRKFSNRKDESKDLRFSKERENRRFSNRNTLSLKKNPKEGRQNIESRMTRS